MRVWILLLMTAGFAVANSGTDKLRTLFTFDDGAAGSWAAVNDTVMGGRSSGGPEIGEGVLRFRGNLSLENNGGFASVRHPVELDLSAHDGIRLRVRGDGRRYQLRLHTDSRYKGRPVAYSGTFTTRDGEWTEADVPFATLEASFRGRELSNYRFDPGQVQLIGILLADKQPGEFRLEVDRIAAY